MLHYFRRVLRLALLIVVCVLFAAGGVFAELTTRTIFVDRFDYTASSASNINSIINNAASLGFTDVVFQVRGRADAFYNGSIYEPKATSAGSVDPLAVAINAAHARGIKLHAWINSLPLWNLNAAPSASTVQNPPLHPFNQVATPTRANPGFRVIDINGNVEPGSGYSTYSLFNPVLPATHDHINNVVRDIATRYDVDGIHLDYIRYAAGTAFNTLPHDDISHQMFMAATGLNGANAANAGAYRNFVTNRITDLVASIKQTVDTIETGNSADPADDRLIELSASVWRDPDVGKNDYLQDYRTWLQQDLLDVAMPMIYLDKGNDATYFNANLKNTLNIANNARVSPTVASYLHTDPARGGGAALTLGEIQRAYEFGADGVGFYDYPAYATKYTAVERERIRSFLDSPTGPGNEIDGFEADEGRFGWNYNLSPQTTGLAPATTIDRVTTEAHDGVGSQQLNLVSNVPGGAWTLRHNSGIGSAAAPAGNMPLAATGYVGFWLKTDDPGITVRLGIDDPIGANSALEQGYSQSVLADNQWHLYQWNLVDDARWDAYAGGANGNIDAYLAGGNVTIDSIFFSGTGNAQIYLDTVSHNFNGLLAAAPLAGDYNDDGAVDAADYAVWRAMFSQQVSPGIGADGNGSGQIDAGDYVVWRRQMNSLATGLSSGGTSIPEPATANLVLLALAGWLWSRGCKLRELRRAELQKPASKSASTSAPT
jgi:uncharacterized lipoprotein YddW (UPF0748 family)